MRFLLLITGLFATTAASAGQIDCSGAETQTEMTICAGEDYSRADAALNAAWKKVRAHMRETDAHLPPNLRGAADALLKGQRAWITYRDGHCETIGYYARGGSLEPMLVASCLADITRHRTEELLLLMAE